MTTDTKAVARWNSWGGERDIQESDDGQFVLFADHERVVADFVKVVDVHRGIIADFTEDIDTLRTALAASRAAVEGLKKDAERYRFLRSAGGAATLRFHNTNPANRDAAIDAAMEKGNV